MLNTIKETTYGSIENYDVYTLNVTQSQTIKAVNYFKNKDLYLKIDSPEGVTISVDLKELPHDTKIKIQNIGASDVSVLNTTLVTGKFVTFLIVFENIILIDTNV